MPEEYSKAKEVGGLFLFIVFAALIIWICLVFEAREAIFAFIGTLFFIYVLPESRFSLMKNVIGSYIITSVTSILVILFLKPIFNVSETLSILLLIVIMLFLSEIVIIISGLDHPPALAIAIFFVLVEFSGSVIIGLSICFVLILIMSIIMKLIKKKTGGDFGGGLGGDVGGGLGNDLGGSSLGGGFGSDIGGGSGGNLGGGKLKI
ncbi:MAG: HPP family protein [Nanoarchaeota archaeon]